MSSSVKIRVPAEEYVIYFTLTDQSNYRITLDCSITTCSSPHILYKTEWNTQSQSQDHQDNTWSMRTQDKKNEVGEFAYKERRNVHAECNEKHELRQYHTHDAVADQYSSTKLTNQIG